MGMIVMLADQNRKIKEKFMSLSRGQMGNVSLLARASHFDEEQNDVFVRDCAEYPVS
jgi:hypothetical protein